MRRGAGVRLQDDDRRDRDPIASLEAERGGERHGGRRDQGDTQRVPQDDGVARQRRAHRREERRPGFRILHLERTRHCVGRHAPVESGDSRRGNAGVLRRAVEQLGGVAVVRELVRDLLPHGAPG